MMTSLPMTGRGFISLLAAAMMPMPTRTTSPMAIRTASGVHPQKANQETGVAMAETRLPGMSSRVR